MLPSAKVVVAGLVPAIHVFLLRNPQQERRCRHKAGHDETNFQYAPVLSASLLVCTRPRLFSILPSTIAKSLRSCAERQERICCSLRFSRGISRNGTNLNRSSLEPLPDAFSSRRPVAPWPENAFGKNRSNLS